MPLYSFLFYSALCRLPFSLFFFLNDPPTPEISPLPLHDALPIYLHPATAGRVLHTAASRVLHAAAGGVLPELRVSSAAAVLPTLLAPSSPARRRRLEAGRGALDRKSTRLNSSHLVISYAVFCLKK